jgi:hypothetical protein
LPGASAAVDGYAVSAALLESGLALDPGSHEIVVTAEGRQPASLRVELREADRIEVALTLARRDPADAVSSSSGAAAGRADRRRRPLLR